MRSWTWVALLAAGCGGVRSAKEAPFSLGPKVALWSQADSDDEASDSAFLVLANDDLGCAVFDGKTYEEALQAVIAKGEGVGMVLQAAAAQGSVVGDLTGLWTEDGGQALEEPYAQARYLAPFAWSEGFAYEVSEEGGAWLQLDEVGETVRGEFRTRWWWGRFKAEACPRWSAEAAGPTAPPT